MGFKRPRVRISTLGPNNGKYLLVLPVIYFVRKFGNLNATGCILQRIAGAIIDRLLSAMIVGSLLAANGRPYNLEGKISFTNPVPVRRIAACRVGRGDTLFFSFPQDLIDNSKIYYVNDNKKNRKMVIGARATIAVSNNQIRSYS